MRARRGRAHASAADCGHAEGARASGRLNLQEREASALSAPPGRGRAQRHAHLVGLRTDCLRRPFQAPCNHAGGCGLAHELTKLSLVSGRPALASWAFPGARHWDLLCSGNDCIRLVCESTSASSDTRDAETFGRVAARSVQLARKLEPVAVSAPARFLKLGEGGKETGRGSVLPCHASLRSEPQACRSTRPCVDSARNSFSTVAFPRRRRGWVSTVGMF